MLGSSSYLVLSRSLKRFQGRQAPFKFPVHRSLVVKVLDFDAPTLALARRSDCLAAALATICCLRPSEGARLQSCDVFFDFDIASGRRGYRGTAAINVMSRKNDQDRKDHHPRIGRSRSNLWLRLGSSAPPLRGRGWHRASSRMLEDTPPSGSLLALLATVPAFEERQGLARFYVG
jgi:hypothetical protein